MTIDQKKKLVFCAAEEITLRCGKSSITLTKSGKVVIRGVYVSSLLSDVNKIKSSSVQRYIAMLQLKNHSPFSPAMMLCANEKGIDSLYIALKATFSYQQAMICISEEQIPPVVKDGYWGDPAESSLRYASDMHLCKTGTDIIVNGHAYAAAQQPVTELDCSIKVGNYSKIIRVFGDRYWHGNKISAPKPFVKMPLIYENAFGGAYIDFIDNGQGGVDQKKVLHASNPVGRGYRGGPGTQTINADVLPNLEDPQQLIQLPGDQPKPTDRKSGV